MELITHGTSDGQGVSELSSDAASWSSFLAEEPADEVQGGESIGNGEGGDLMHLELTDFTNATFKARASERLFKKRKRIKEERVEGGENEPFTHPPNAP